MPEQPTHSAGHPGFTLVSALITVAILGITMAVAGPALWEMSHEIKLKNAARETLTAMRAARFKAINEVREYGVVATLGSNLASPGSISIFRGNDPTDATAVIQRIEIPGGILVTAAAFDTNTHVIFSPDGSADNLGAIELTNANQRVLTVRLDPATTARMWIDK
jgi:Tfp pilus assembly protein FimT